MRSLKKYLSTAAPLAYKAPLAYPYSAYHAPIAAPYAVKTIAPAYSYANTYKVGE